MIAGPAAGDPLDRQLTVLLTLKDRPAFTLRWMDYANQTGFPFKVLVADGSLEDAAQSLLADKARFPRVDYEYVRYPHDVGYAEYYAKMADALTRIGTPYVVMADNDDFYVVNGLRQALRFLASHENYAACGGQGAIFWMGPALDPGPKALLHDRSVEWKCTREARSVDAETARERVDIVSVSKSDTFYYDVKRVAAAREHMAIVRALDLHDLFLVEHLIWYLVAISGKTKRLDGLYLARQQNAPASSGGRHAELYGDWFGRMLLPTWSADFDKFLRVAASALARADGLSEAEATRCVIASYRASVAPALLSDLMNERTVSAPMSMVVGAVRRLVGLPPRSLLRRAARTLYRRLGWVSLDIVYGTEFLASPVPGAAEAFEPIRAFLTGKTPETYATNSVKSEIIEGNPAVSPCDPAETRN